MRYAVIVGLVLGLVGLAGAEDVASYFAFEPSFTGGVQVAVCGVDPLGAVWVVTTPGAGGASFTRIDTFGGDPNQAYAIPGLGEIYPGFLGGLTVSCQFVGSTLWIVTGAGPGGGPHVRVFRFVFGAP